MKVYNKLVRDKIPEIISRDGSRAVTRVLDDGEYLSALDKKLFEEIREYLESGSVEELADIAEVFSSILAARGIAVEELLTVMEDKRLSRGGFSDKIFLECVEDVENE